MTTHNNNNNNNNNNTFFFSTLSEQCLNTVHKELNILAHEVLKISPIDFSITCGYRSELYQKKLYNEGKSKTLNSKHTQCKAIDFVPYINNKQDFTAIKEAYIITGLFIAKAKELDIKIRTGALWNYDNTKENMFEDVWHVEMD